MDYVCRRCGSSSFRYNRSSMRMECEICGAPAADPQQDQQRMQFDRTYAQAINHLAAGNWSKTIALVSPLMGQYPKEKKLYLAAFRAATQDFCDIDMENAANRATASDAWDKLVRLHGITGEMIRYGRLREEKHRQELGRKRTIILVWIFAAAACAILGGLMFDAACYFTALLCTVGLAGCLSEVYIRHPVRVVRQLIATAPDEHSNPFI